MSNKKLIKIISLIIFTTFIITIISITNNPIASAKNRFSEIYSINVKITNLNIKREYTFTKKDDIAKLLDIANRIEKDIKNHNNTYYEKAYIKYTVFMNDNSTIQFDFKEVNNYYEYFKNFPNVYNDLTNQN